MASDDPPPVLTVRRRVVLKADVAITPAQYNIFTERDLFPPCIHGPDVIAMEVTTRRPGMRSPSTRPFCMLIVVCSYSFAYSI